MFTFLDPYRSTIPSSSEMLAETFVKPSKNEQLCPFLQTMDTEEKVLLETAIEIQIDADRQILRLVAITNGVAVVLLSSLSIGYCLLSKDDTEKKVRNIFDGGLTFAAVDFSIFLLQRHCNAREVGYGYGLIRLSRLQRKVSSIGEELVRVQDTDTPAMTIQQLSLAQQGFNRTITHYSRVLRNSSARVEWRGFDGSRGNYEFGERGVRQVESVRPQFVTTTRTYHETRLTHEREVTETRQRYTHTERTEQKFY